MSSSTVFSPLERSRYFRDEDGALATTKRQDEVLKLTLDWTDDLASAETVSSAAYVDSGVTTSSKSVATPQTLVTVSGVGEFEITVTLSTGRKLQRVVRYYPTDGRISDYP